MPLKPFQYYMVAITRYICTTEFKSTIDFSTSSDINFFLWRVMTLLTDKPGFILSIWDEIDAALRAIAEVAPHLYDEDEFDEDFLIDQHAKLQAELANVRLAHHTALAS